MPKPASRTSTHAGFVSRGFIRTRTAEDVGHGVIPLVARVFEQASILLLPHWKRRGPGPGERFRILDREPVVDGVRVDTPEALDHTQRSRVVDLRGHTAIRTAWIDRRLVGEVGHLDDQRVALPVSARVSHPLADAGLEM